MRGVLLLISVLAILTGTVVVLCLCLDWMEGASSSALWLECLGLVGLGVLPIGVGLFLLKNIAVAAQQDNGAKKGGSKKKRKRKKAKHAAPQPSFAMTALGLAALVLASGGAWWKLQPQDVAPPVNDAAAAEKTLEHEAELDLKKQEHIWEIEHLTFDIETKVAKQFSQALVDADLSKLQSYFADDCDGQIFDVYDGKETRGGEVTEVRRSATGRKLEAADAERLVARLVKLLDDFETVQRHRTRILQIDAANTERTRWDIQLLISVTGQSKSTGPIISESTHWVEMAIADDADLAKGKLITRWQFETESLRACPRPLLREVTNEVGLAALDLPDNWELPLEKTAATHFSAAVDDFNGDGFVDIVVASYERSFLLKSHGGERFEDVSSMLPSDEPSSNLLTQWIDYDNDGDSDLILRDRLFRNDNGRFVDVSEFSGLTFKFHPMSCIVADYDCDGLLDVYVYYTIPAPEDEHPNKIVPWVGDEESGVTNQLWHNEGRGRFRDVTSESGTDAGRRQTYAAVWFYYDDDHFPDLYVANDFGQNVLLRNRGNGTFEDLSARSGAADFATSMGVAAGDINNDGSSDLYVANMYSKMGRRIIAHLSDDDYPAGIFPQIRGSCAGNRLYMGGGGGKFTEISEDVHVNGVGWAYAPAMADFDSNGFLDLYATTGYMSFDRKKPDG